MIIIRRRSPQENYCHHKLNLERLFLKKVLLNMVLFMKKDKLACGTIFLNVADYLLHHVTHVEIEKDA